MTPLLLNPSFLYNHCSMVVSAKFCCLLLWYHRGISLHVPSRQAGSGEVFLDVVGFRQETSPLVFLLGSLLSNEFCKMGPLMGGALPSGRLSHGPTVVQEVSLQCNHFKH